MDGDGGLPSRRHLSHHPRGGHLPRHGTAGKEWDGWTAHHDTYVAEGENVVVLARYTTTNWATREPVDVRVAHHFVGRGGLIVRFEQFVDTALVRDAMRG